MSTSEKLNKKFAKTNITENLLLNLHDIETFLGKEIENVRTFKCGFNRNSFHINPGDAVFQNNYPCTCFRPFSMINKNYSFDFNNGVLSVTGRNKWQRTFSNKTFQLEKVGYKLKTTHLDEGYIWGNPIEI